MTFRDTTDSSWAVLFDAQVKVSSVFLRRLAYRILRDGGAAEDVCQQAFMKAWTERESLRSSAVLSAWLAKTVVYESLQLYRRRRLETRTTGLLGPLILDSIDHPALRVDLRESILFALQSLPEPRRTIVVLRVIDEMSNRDTAEQLGLATSVVSKQLRHGLMELKELLKNWKPNRDA